MPKTFNGMDFDIHEFGKPIELKLTTIKERISARMKRDLEKAMKEKTEPKKKKSLIIALASTIVLPGLGSVYIKRTFVGITLLSFNLFFLLLGFSLFNLFTSQFLSMPFFSKPCLSHPFSTCFPSRFVLLFAWSILFTIAAWVHLIYQLIDSRKEFELIA